jgi:hypothetical protein
MMVPQPEKGSETQEMLDVDSILDLQKIMESDGGVMGTVEDVAGEVAPPIEDEDEDKGIRLITSPPSKYQDMTVSGLKDILLEHNLPLSGNKTKLIKRIQDNVVIRKVSK